MNKRNRKLNTFFLSAAMIVLWVVLFSRLAVYMNSQSSKEQKEGLETAIERDITTCYALEGSYPPDLQYMKDHYGLSYDESLFFVDYRPVASNIRPSYIIIELTPLEE